MLYRNELIGLLKEKGHIDDEQARQLEAEIKDADFPLKRSLIERRIVDSSVLLEAAGELYGVPRVLLHERGIDEAAAMELPRELCERHGLIAFQSDEEALHVAFSEPADLLALDAVRRVTRKEIVAYIGAEDEIRGFSSSVFGAVPLSEGLFDEESDDQEDATEDDMIDDVPLARYINEIIDNAVARHASDIHFEPHEKRSLVRFRVDGMLQEFSELPRNSYAKVVSRIKLQSGMDIAVTHRPQDGRVRRTLSSGARVDIRVSSIPTVLGEKLVLRILDQRNVVLTPERLGLLKEDLATLERLISNPHGLVVVCGPTGSGKTTTLYAVLNKLNEPHVNIISLEDPVEYRLAGISQMQVNERQQLTFATGLRAILRQDPDIILVGETRDEETARLSVQAALTGHLVFTTLHTNTAVGAITRLLNMSVEPFLVASSLIGSISQRLLRRTCIRCKQEYAFSERELSALGIPLEKKGSITGFRGAGCLSCQGTGYKGRVAVYEMLVVDDEFRNLIVSGVGEQELLSHAVSKGMVTLLESSRNAVLRGDTDVDEMLRVIHRL